MIQKLTGKLKALLEERCEEALQEPLDHMIIHFNNPDDRWFVSYTVEYQITYVATVFSINGYSDNRIFSKIDFNNDRHTYCSSVYYNYFPKDKE